MASPRITRFGKAVSSKLQKVITPIQNRITGSDDLPPVHTVDARNDPDQHVIYYKVNTRKLPSHLITRNALIFMTIW